VVRKARINEVPEIRAFLADREQHGIIPRSLAYLYAHLRDYFIIEGCVQGHFVGIVGVAALHLCWDGIGEIRSLVVRPDAQGEKVGSALMTICLHEAKELGLRKVFLLSLIPDYFKRFGFQVVTRDDLHPTTWADCVDCVKFPNCDEVPMILEL
jgi:amino-acid N-acetyltransferase